MVKSKKLCSPIIEESWKPLIKAAKYNGKDNSIFYQYIASPLCDKFITFLPKSLA